ncbi:MAG: hypothetical protein OXF06_11755 [Bacteroidetes bacterium]|nr:hypothetical protein [Bacteroidota bacterium]
MSWQWVPCLTAIVEDLLHQAPVSALFWGKMLEYCFRGCIPSYMLNVPTLNYLIPTLSEFHDLLRKPHRLHPPLNLDCIGPADL